MRVRVSNDLIHRVRFFLQGVTEMETKGRDVFRQVLVMRTEVEHAVLELGKRAVNGRALLNLLYRKPVVSAADIETALSVSTPTANALITGFRTAGDAERNHRATAGAGLFVRSLPTPVR